MKRSSMERSFERARAPFSSMEPLILLGRGSSIERKFFTSALAASKRTVVLEDR